jgi:hypothetical protein
MNQAAAECPADVIEREKATFGLQKLDRLVRRDWGMFPETKERWLQEGWDGDPGIFSYDPNPYYGISLVDLVGIDVPVAPLFENRIVKSDEHYVYEQTSAGAIEKFPVGKKRHREAMPEYWQNPVECRDDWFNKIKPRLDPDTPERWRNLAYADEAAQLVGQGRKLYEASAIGAYMYLRALMGPEKVLYAFYDDPDLIHDMMRTWLNLVQTCLLRVQSRLPFFKLLFGEDIAYKNGLLISPAMIDEFLTPYYLVLLKSLCQNQAETIHFEIDSDGNMAEFLPIYIRMGFTAFRPFEIAAGNDIVSIGQAYPQIMLSGGIDKRILGDSKEAIKKYVESVIPFFVKRGGFFPTCDHAIPSTVPFENYLYYRQLVTQIDSRSAIA